MSTAMASTQENEKLRIAHRIKALILEVSKLAAKSGVEICPYLNPDDLVPYERFGPTQLLKVEASVTDYYETLQESMTSSAAGSDGKQIFWYILQKMQLTPTSDFFSYASNEYIFEIYDSSFKQVFRNLNFFHISSYTLEELYLNEWRELFERNPFLDRKIGIEAVKIFDGTYTQTTPISIGKHLLNERFSERKLLLAGNFCYFSPLYDKLGNVVACAVLSKVELLGSLAENPSLINEYSLSAEKLSESQTLNL